MTSKAPQMPPVKATRPPGPPGPPDSEVQRLRKTLEHYQGMLDQSERIRVQQSQVLELSEQRSRTFEGLVHKLERDRFLLDWLEALGIETIYFIGGEAAIIGNIKPLRERLGEYINKRA
jgi:hypothetical protein